MTHSDDNVVFDRLADGGLSPAERRELLSSLDGRPDGWRRCALAFLEAQVLRSEFKSFLAHELSPTVVQAAAASTPTPARPIGRYRLLGSSLAMAATALLAFGIGWRMNAPNQTAPTAQDFAAHGVPAPKQFADPRDAVTLVVQDDQGQPQRLRLPLMDAGRLGDQWAQLSPEVPVDLRAGLRDRGYDVKSTQRFAPLFFEQDKRLVPMVVPVNDTYVVPVNRPVY